MSTEPTQAEMKAAAEWWADSMPGSLQPDASRYVITKREYDCAVRFAEADRAERQKREAEDAEPITAEWWHDQSRFGIGGADDLGGGFSLYRYQTGDVSLDHDNFNLSLTLPGVKTRGDIRRLCEALGIPLEEQE